MSNTGHLGRQRTGGGGSIFNNKNSDSEKENPKNNNQDSISSNETTPNKNDNKDHHSQIPSVIPSKPPPVGENENPLSSAYTFWFSQRGRSAKNKTSAGDFEQNIKYICSVSSVEQFWRAYSRIIQPNELTGRCDIHLFKFGIRPMWEDEANKNGGKWQVRLKKGVATRCWENLILAMVGEQFACGDEICGAVVSVRYHTEDIVGVWNRTATNLAIITQIRDIMKRVLNLPTSSIMEYKEHFESIKDASNRQNNYSQHQASGHHSNGHVRNIDNEGVRGGQHRNERGGHRGGRLIHRD